ncbi:hypothetical protein [Paenibacillus turpanensis]|uniref:hypothetical protein n=1 Tax=Paenibacillus turpanensis TaxID=2689078 RepID=UPI00140A0FA4|nr:hypothetical protein [Paenibacillus turpanensis]
MAQNRKLTTDQDFSEAMEKERGIRVFKDDLIVDSGGTIIRFDEETVVIQSGVSDVTYHSRTSCEFFEMRKK